MSRNQFDQFERLDPGCHDLIPAFHNLRTLLNRFRCLKDDSPRAPSKLELSMAATPDAAAEHKP